ncbi:hypothetical protein F5Y19DRAFT_471630 [Xylariaceae sp. FL1651]|nr:hypothetical protein F5Y19DRAFT_471630 [Xylariaceae sp. FL1651]
MLLYVTFNSSGYFENLRKHSPESRYSSFNYAARGILIESQGCTYFYGSASGHSQMYQYQLSNTSNIFLGHMRTETPYYQPNPIYSILTKGNLQIISPRGDMPHLLFYSTTKNGYTSETAAWLTLSTTGEYIGSGDNSGPDSRVVTIDPIIWGEPTDSVTVQCFPLCTYVLITTTYAAVPNYLPLSPVERIYRGGMVQTQTYTYPGKMMIAGYISVIATTTIIISDVITSIIPFSNVPKYNTHRFDNFLGDHLGSRSCRLSRYAFPTSDSHTWSAQTYVRQGWRLRDEMSYLYDTPCFLFYPDTHDDNSFDLDDQNKPEHPKILTIQIAQMTTRQRLPALVAHDVLPLLCDVGAQDNRPPDPDNQFIYPPLPGPQFSNDLTVFWENLNIIVRPQNEPFKWVSNMSSMYVSLLQEGAPDLVNSVNLTECQPGSDNSIYWNGDLGNIDLAVSDQAFLAACNCSDPDATPIFFSHCINLTTADSSVESPSSSSTNSASMAI